MINDFNNKCPHCLVAYHSTFSEPQRTQPIGEDTDGYWWFRNEACPACKKQIIWLGFSEEKMGGPGVYPGQPFGERRWELVRPKASGRPPVPTEVPEEFAEDYREACLVLADSPKASAALSRRCLQHILRERAQVKSPNDLARAIQEVVDDPKVSTEISESLDIVRNIGNFSVHPNKSQHSGEIVEVEPGEAEWCLEVIEMLFDYYFVRPADIQRRIQTLDSKLDESGKPPITRPNIPVKPQTTGDP